MPFSKVDKERRIVSGFASLDNLDKQNDIVTAEASMKAFAKFRGNIREWRTNSNSSAKNLGHDFWWEIIQWKLVKLYLKISK